MKPTTAWVTTAAGALGGAGTVVGAYAAAHVAPRGRVVATLCAATAGAALALVSNHWRHLSITDDATLLHNRRYLFARLGRELRHGARMSRPVAFVVAEIDDMRRYNNTFGHLAGDDVLLAVARTLRSGVRRGDIVARWGGDEFGIILPNTDLATAARIAERLRCLVDGISLSTDQGPIGDITISAGVAAQFPANRSQRALMAAADAAMYAAKQRKNDVVVADE